VSGGDPPALRRPVTPSTVTSRPAAGPFRALPLYACRTHPGPPALAGPLDAFPLHDVKHPRPPHGGAKLLEIPSGAGPILRSPPPRGAWWSWTGSNRRPHACKARALPTELQPREAAAPVVDPGDLVGLGRLERPTSPLSGVRSNHLSYRPMGSALSRSPGRGRKRNEDGASRRAGLTDPCDPTTPWEWADPHRTASLERR
jgi:hypothetical protein